LPAHDHPKQAAGDQPGDHGAAAIRHEVMAPRFCGGVYMQLLYCQFNYGVANLTLFGAKTKEEGKITYKVYDSWNAL
jgi:hypothetical protein